MDVEAVEGMLGYEMPGEACLSYQHHCSRLVGGGADLLKTAATTKGKRVDEEACENDIEVPGLTCPPRTIWGRHQVSKRIATLNMATHDGLQVYYHGVPHTPVHEER